MGWHVGYRTANNVENLDINDSSASVYPVSVTVTPPSLNIFEFAMDLDGSPSNYGDSVHGCMGFVLAPESWSAGDFTALYNAAAALEAWRATL